MTTTITRKHTVVVESSRGQRLADLDRNYRGQRQYRGAQPISVPTELALSEFDPHSLDLSALTITGIKVVHFANGLGATVDLSGALGVGEQPMRCSLHLGDSTHRFEAKSVEAWVKTMGLKETNRTQWQTSHHTGDVYETISFGSVTPVSSDDAFNADHVGDAF
jgi:hypothetical protein